MKGRSFNHWICEVETVIDRWAQFVRISVWILTGRCVDKLFPTAPHPWGGIIGDHCIIHISNAVCRSRTVDGRMGHGRTVCSETCCCRVGLVWSTHSILRSLGRQEQPWQKGQICTIHLIGMASTPTFSNTSRSQSWYYRVLWSQCAQSRYKPREHDSRE